MVLTTATFQFLRKEHFMFSPVTFLGLEERNILKPREACIEVKISELTRLLLSEEDLLLVVETTAIYYLTTT